MDISRQIWSIRHQEEEEKARQLAKNSGLEYVDLVGYPFSADVLLVAPKAEFVANGFIPYLKAGRSVKVAILSQPTASQKTKIQSYFPGFEINLAIVSKTGWQSALAEYDKLAVEAKKKKQAAAQKTGIEFAKLIKNIGDISAHLKKVSTTQLLELLLTGAVATRASDIHLEPTETDCRLRFRIDGVLLDVAKLRLDQYHSLNSRIKNLGGLKLDIGDKPQDGRFDSQAGGRSLDIRVSSMPGAHGEIIVMRLLLPDNLLLRLDKLGLSSSVRRLIDEAISKPHGMILNTGPTGSGKTTTLYAILGELNKPPVKIITIEDPVEYQLVGINQTQVNKTSGYTFATALASAVRQDPDIIMVGEIRDADTAKIALQAGLTGHLVLTTLHTNTASGAIPRLLDMGIEPYLLAGSVNLIIAQRLIRRLCDQCQGKGCEICQKSGFLGRIPIMEALKPTTEFNELITRKASIEEFETKAKELGMKTMLEDGMEKVKQGLTTKGEVERVTE